MSCILGQDGFLLPSATMWLPGAYCQNTIKNWGQQLYFSLVTLSSMGRHEPLNWREIVLWIFDAHWLTIICYSLPLEFICIRISHSLSIHPDKGPEIMESNYNQKRPISQTHHCLFPSHPCRLVRVAQNPLKSFSQTILGYLKPYLMGPTSLHS